MTRLSTIIAVSALCACGANSPKTEHATVEDVKYGPCPPSLPESCEMAVLDGNPAKAGSYTVRFRTTGPFFLPPHTHPKESQVTVLEGSVSLGLGSSGDKSKGKTYVAGQSYTSAADTPHYTWADAATTLEITGEGPRASLPIGANHQH